MITQLGWTLLALCVSFTGGCEKPPDANREKTLEAAVEKHFEGLLPQMAAEMAARERSDEHANKANAMKAKREALQHQPKDFFEVSGLRFAAASNDTHAVDALTLTNKSMFAVAGAVARVDYMRNGVSSAQVELTLTGSLPAGGTRTFSVADHTLDGASVQIVPGATNVAVTSVVLAASPQDFADISTL